MVTLKSVLVRFNDKIIAKALSFNISDSLPLVQLKHSLNTFCPEPEANHMLNMLTASILQQKM